MDVQCFVQRQFSGSLLYYRYEYASQIFSTLTAKDSIMHWENFPFAPNSGSSSTVLMTVVWFHVVH
jgi:hypothetical protein